MQNMAATGFAIIKALGVSGGIVGPFVIGAIKQATGSFVLPMWILACFYCVGALLYMQARRFVRRDLLCAATLDKKLTPASSFADAGDVSKSDEPGIRLTTRLANCKLVL